MNKITKPKKPRPSIRWWPAILIVVAMMGILAWIWLRDVASTQNQVVKTFPTLFFGAVFLFLWLVLFSRLSGRLRLTIFLLSALMGGLGLVLLEIKGVDGNLVPIVGYRWSADTTFEQQAAKLDGTTHSGPGDYPQFYGPERLATLVGRGLETDWKGRPPRELWRRPVGEAWSSFAVVGGAAVTQEQRGEEQTVVRYALHSGEQIWVRSLGDSFTTTIAGRGPRSTPTILDDRVWAMTANGVLACIDLDTGELVWSRDVLADHGAGRPEWGMASSPLVVDGVVIVQLGKRGQGLAAYDRASGEIVWTAGQDSGTYSSPILAEVLGRRLVLIVQRDSVLGHDPASGEVVLSAQWPNPTGGERITMPLMLADDRMLVSAGYGVGSRMFRFDRGEKGLEVELVWESPRLKSKFAPMVQRDGTVYGLDDGVLVALDPVTGERRWKRGRYGHGQMILVDDLLLIQAENGDVVLVEANPEEHRELAKISAIDGKTWNPPALSGNLLLVRNNEQAVCYELPQTDRRVSR